MKVLERLPALIYPMTVIPFSSIKSNATMRLGRWIIN